MWGDSRSANQKLNQLKVNLICKIYLHEYSFPHSRESMFSCRTSDLFDCRTTVRVDLQYVLVYLVDRQADSRTGKSLQFIFYWVFNVFLVGNRLFEVFFAVMEGGGRLVTGYRDGFMEPVLLLAFICRYQSF